MCFFTNRRTNQTQKEHKTIFSTLVVTVNALANLQQPRNEPLPLRVLSLVLNRWPFASVYIILLRESHGSAFP